MLPQLQKLVVSGTCLVLALAPWAQASLVEHRFDADAQGWTAVTISGDFCLTPPTSPPSAPAETIVFEADTGWPGGCVRHNPPSEGRNSFWQAPSDFLGNQSAAYGGILSFDMKQSSNTTGASPWVILQGGGITLFQTSSTDAATDVPGNRWRRFRIVLGPGEQWTVGTCNGNPATASQIQQALSDVTRLLIRAEYVTGSETNRLDNVVLTASGTPISTFDVDSEDWWFVYDALYPSWDASGGDPGGCLLERDSGQGEGYRILAPAKFLGNRADAIKQTLEFDLKATPGLSDPQTFLDGRGFVYVSGGGIRLTFEQKSLPIVGNVWRHHAIPLTPCPSWVRSSDREIATQADFDIVMAALSSLSIRGEFSRNGGESERVDNVRLGTCAPSAVAWAQPALICQGDSTTVSLAAAGDGPFSYRWRFNSVPIDPAQNASAITASLELTNFAPSAAGSYDCTITGACGTTVSSPAVLSVMAPGSGDANRSGTTDGLDIAGFINALIADAEPVCACDMDGNGIVDSSDMALFLAVLLGS